jgi:hypothetical protein
VAATVERDPVPRSLHARRCRGLARGRQRVFCGAHARTERAPFGAATTGSTTPGGHRLRCPGSAQENPTPNEESPLTIEFQDVKVVAESDRGLCCRITGRNHWIASHRLLEGSSVAHFGDRGTVVVTSEFAEREGLLKSPFPPL